MIPHKTPSDCAKYPVVSMCDLHATDGGWKHNKGVEPCEVRMG
jgi:hypothetical protein